MFGQNITEHNPAPPPSGHPLLSGPQNIFTNIHPSEPLKVCLLAPFTLHMGKRSKKKPQREEGDEEAVGPGGSGAEEDPALALSKLLDKEYNAGPWPAVQLQKGDDGYKFGTRFKQQRYKVSIVPWQSPVFMLAFGALVGTVFISFGAATLEAAEGLHVVRKVYDCNFPGSEEKCACDGMASCTTPLEVPLGMDGDLVLFYELGGFKQNHRRYKPSFAPQHGQTPRSAVPQFGLCPSSERAWRLWAARHSHGSV